MRKIIGLTHISAKSFANRKKWINSIKQRGGSFIDETNRLYDDLKSDVLADNGHRLYDHIRLCGNIPEEYHHDSSEEKQYSKYTDALLSLAYERIGLKSAVLSERADVADVEVAARTYSFVADAKAFRLSRTAKNQKDFKVQQMDNWKHGKPFAMVVCPIYQLPSKNSQIYNQAITRSVCLFTYSHLNILVRIAQEVSTKTSQNLLEEIFNTIPLLNPSKDSHNYWVPVNRLMIQSCKEANNFWKEEKEAVLETIELGKKESLEYLATLRDQMIRMTREEAVRALIQQSKIDEKIKQIKRVSDNGLFGAK